MVTYERPRRLTKPNEETRKNWIVFIFLQRKMDIAFSFFPEFATLLSEPQGRRLSMVGNMTETGVCGRDDWRQSCHDTFPTNDKTHNASSYSYNVTLRHLLATIRSKTWHHRNKKKKKTRIKFEKKGATLIYALRPTPIVTGTCVYSRYTAGVFIKGGT